jgi:hypothetical protein
VGVGVGVRAAQLKSDSNSFPGRFVCAFISVQLPVVWTMNCWLPFGLTLNAVTVSVPQLNCATSVPTGCPGPTWLLTKCQVPVPLHVAPILPGFKSAARACATATRASADSNNVKFVVRFIFVVRFLCMDVVAKILKGTRKVRTKRKARTNNRCPPRNLGAIIWKEVQTVKKDSPKDPARNIIPYGATTAQCG